MQHQKLEQQQQQRNNKEKNSIEFEWISSALSARVRAPHATRPVIVYIVREVMIDWKESRIEGAKKSVQEEKI